MKKLGVVATAVFVLALVGLIVGQVAFAEGGQVKRKDFALIGSVVSVDVPASRFEVAPEAGYWGGGSVVTIYINGQTKFAPAGVDLSTLEVGDEVRTSGRLVAGQLVAEVVALAP